MPEQPAPWLRWLARMGERRKLGDVAMDLLLFAGMMTAGLYVARNFLNPILSNLADPDKEKHEQARRQAKAHLERLNRRRRSDEDADDESGGSRKGLRVEELVLNEYENLIALEMVAPEDIHVGFDGESGPGKRDHIGGLEMIIEELKESVIYPLTMPHLYSHAAPLLSAPSGVLLFGPPGCGKTMLAKAVAHESGASFINLHISTMTEKWYGDSNKIVRAVFSLARKMQPAIIFIDEIDAVLGTRRSGEHEASGMVKAEFMTLWDGLTSANSSGMPAQIVVLGATNRIHDIDEAILRRMPKKFPVPLPGQEQRRRILQLVLQDTKTDPEHFDVDYVSKITAGMSGSDIKEACRDAAMAPVREYMRKHRGDGRRMAAVDASQFRGIRTDDFFGRRSGHAPAAGHDRNSDKKGSKSKGSSDEYEDVDEAVAEDQD
ncbi:Protein MSP1 [Tolypocladium paradoxum]|uniref:Protein MSP1 n=1 Tax=Tolypocladium paradoxum TaxID=94208 RepID=A0A2S4L2I8_9HYPO|nr:Protein MSP1 [Tolypocladium paradoxum]